MPSPFPTTKVHVTQNSPDGKATFIPNTPPPTQAMSPAAQLSYIYSSPPAPIDLATDADLSRHLTALTTTPFPSFPVSGGTTMVICDFGPNPEGAEGFMHKTNSLDYIVVLDGEIELTLFGGEKRVFGKGEVIVQRACWHAWRNMSKMEGARFLAVSVGGEGAVEGEMEFGGPST